MCNLMSGLLQVFISTFAKSLAKVVFHGLLRNGMFILNFCIFLVLLFMHCFSPTRKLIDEHSVLAIRVCSHQCSRFS